MTSTLPITDDELPALFAGLEAMPLALAVSGGADSMALMHMIARWAAREDVRAAYWANWLDQTSSRRRFSSIHSPAVQWNGLARPLWLIEGCALSELHAAGGVPQVIVFTVDHGLRPESANEAAFVVSEAEKLGLPCQVLRWEGEKPTTRIQENARNARRDLLLDALRAERGVLHDIFIRNRLKSRLDRCLILAHHQEDQAETVLMRLARGSGIEGLGGMRARAPVVRAPSYERPEHFEVEVARPLLEVSKLRLVATLNAYGAHWIDDPSNEDERFERVRVRRVLTQLAEIGLSAEKLALSARRLRDAEEALQCQRPDKPPFVHMQWLQYHVADVPLQGDWFLAPYLLVRTLRWLTRLYGGAARWAELSQIEQLASRILDAKNGGAAFRGVTLSGCKVEIHGEERHFLRLYREGSGEGLQVATIAPGQIVDWDGGRFTIEAGGSAPPGATVRALGPRDWADLKRAVKGLGDLGWPAAAVATVPVIEWGGGIIAYPVIDQAVGALPDEKRQIKERWTAFTAGLRQADYCASFRPRRW